MVASDKTLADLLAGCTVTKFASGSLIVNTKVTMQKSNNVVVSPATVLKAMQDGSTKLAQVSYLTYRTHFHVRN